MSIASQITRLTTLRNTIRTKLKTLGIISNDSASLSDCSTAINNLSKVTPSTPATTVTITTAPTINSSTGVVTMSGSASASVKPTISKGYTDGSSTAGTITATVSSKLQLSPTLGAQTITPGTSNKTIAAGRWLTGTQTIAGSSNLIPSNIKSGVKIFNVTGSMSAGFAVKRMGSTVVSSLSCTSYTYNVTFPAAATVTRSAIAVPLSGMSPTTIIGFSANSYTSSSTASVARVSEKASGESNLSWYDDDRWRLCDNAVSGDTLYIPLSSLLTRNSTKYSFFYTIIGG